MYKTINKITIKKRFPNQKENGGNLPGIGAAPQTELFSKLKPSLKPRLVPKIGTSKQGFKFRFGSHFGLDIETEYFVFRIVSIYHFGVH